MAEARQADRRGAYRPGLDGVRGLAVAVVIAYHLGYLDGGFLGVDLFFVLSGFLITGLALNEIGGSGGLALRAFWTRRIRRLVPALLLVTTTVVVVAIAIGWPDDQLRSLALDALSTLTWWNNWRQAGGTSYWAAEENLFRHAWSLSIEEQFYVLWPLVLVGCAAVARRTRRSVVLVVGVAAGVGAAASAAWQLVLSHRLAVEDLSRVYVGTDTRAVAPLLGCALACVLAGTRRHAAPGVRRVLGYAGAATLAVLVVSAQVASPELYRNGLLLLASLASAALVSWTALAEEGDRDPIARAVTVRPARYLGARSYGLYLWSWPVQVLLLFQWPELSKAALAATTIASSLVLAELSHRFVENPLRHRHGWAATPAAHRLAWTTGVVGSAAAVLLAFGLASPAPVHQQLETAESADAALAPPPSEVPDTEASGQGALQVMITGDSVAFTVGYYKPSPDELPEGIASIDTRALIGCGLLAGEGWAYPQGGVGGPFVTPGGGACERQPEAEEVGLSGSPDVVMVFPGAWEWGDAQSPEGQVVEAQSEEMESVLHDRLLRRAEAAHEVGARFVQVAWVCPGSRAAGERKDPEFIEWINGLMEDVAAEAREQGIDAEVMLPNDEVCIDGDPTGEPTPAKIEATNDEVHVVDDAGGKWIWDTWLGPALTG